MWYAISACCVLCLWLSNTYADCGEDILKLVDKGDEAWVVHIDAAAISMPLNFLCAAVELAHALGFVCAMAGGAQEMVGMRCGVRGRARRWRRRRRWRR